MLYQINKSQQHLGQPLSPCYLVIVLRASFIIFDLIKDFQNHTVKEVKDILLLALVWSGGGGGEEMTVCYKLWRLNITFMAWLVTTRGVVGGCDLAW